MRRYLALVAVLITALAAPHGAAAKDSLLLPSRDRAYRALRAFDALCLSHRLDRDGALKAAADDGWLILPDGQMPAVGGVYEAIKGLKLTDLVARWKPSPEGDMVLLLGDGGSAGPGCAVAFRSGFRMASSVMGGSEMAPIPRTEVISSKYDLWAFVEEGDRRRAVKSFTGKIDETLIARASAERRFANIAVLGEDADEAAVYLYSIPPPQRLPEPAPPPSAFTPNPSFDRSSCQAARDAWLEKHGATPAKRVRLMERGSVEAVFLRFDLDCDQRLSRDEYIEMSWDALRSDTGANGEITYTEFMERCEPPRHLDPVAARRICERIWLPHFRRAKAPGRQVITKASYSRVFATEFRKADRNRDGALTISADRRRYAYD